METILILKGVIVTVFVIFYLYLGIKVSDDCLIEDCQEYKEGKRKFVVVANHCQWAIMIVSWLPWVIIAIIGCSILQSITPASFFGDYYYDF